MTLNDIKSLRRDLNERIKLLRETIETAEELLAELPSTPVDYAGIDTEELDVMIADAEAFLEDSDIDL